MAKTSLPNVQKKLAEEQKAKEAKEDAAAAALPKQAGEVTVRLIRPFLRASGVMLEPGVHVLPAAEVPKSAKRVGRTGVADE